MSLLLPPAHGAGHFDVLHWCRCHGACCVNRATGECVCRGCAHNRADAGTVRELAADTRRELAARRTHPRPRLPCVSMSGLQNFIVHVVLIGGATIAAMQMHWSASGHAVSGRAGRRISRRAGKREEALDERLNEAAATESHGSSADSDTAGD